MNKQVLACILSAALVLAALTGCSETQSRATCFDCTTTPQKWSDFGFEKLEGTWRGIQHVSTNEAAAAKVVTKETPIEVAFLEGKKFLRAYKIAPESCAGFPEEAVVLMNELWWDKSTAQPNDERAFEVFGKASGDRVTYGRAYVKRSPAAGTPPSKASKFQQVPGGDTAATCDYVGSERPITMNRLALPAVTYSRRVSQDGRAVASVMTKEVDVNFEFLNFDQAKIDSDYRYKGKREKEAPLFFRFVKTTRNVTGPFDDGNWNATEEKLFRLWRVD